MMSSVPVVKPAMPPSNPQPPKVMSGAPSASQLVSGPQAPIVGPPKVLTSPVKPTAAPSANHTSAALPLSLVQEHKVNASVVPVQMPPTPRTPEKKEPQVPKPTANGVEGPQNRQAPAPEPKKPDDGVTAAPVVNHAPEASQPALAPAPAPSGPPPASAPPLAPVLAPTPTPQPNNPPTSVGQQSLPKPPPVAAGPQPPSTVAQSTGETKPPAPPAPEHPSQPLPKPVLEVKRTLEPPPKPEFKVATPPRNNKRKRDVKPMVEVKTTPSQSDERKSKRVRTRTQPYQSPLPELLFISKLKTPIKSPDDKLIVFYKSEFLAVRNAEGGFYVCQAMQNIYKTSPKIRIRWLSQEKKDSKLTDVYVPDFYDTTDFDCILTNLDLKRVDKNRYQLPESENERTQSILKRALDVEKGVSEKPSVTEEHPDGLDLSLFRDESQLKTRRNSKQATKRKKAKGKENSEVQAEGSGAERKSPRKAGRTKSRERPGARGDKKVEGGARDRAAAAKRRSEVAAALAKQAAVKQTVARGALPKPPPPKKSRASPPQPAPVPAPAASPSPTKSPKKVETVPEPSSPTRSSKTRSGKAASTPPKTLPTTRTKEREQQRGTTSPTAAKGRKKPGKKA